MSRFSISAAGLADLKLIKRTHLGDSRGFLSRLFCAEELAPAGWCKSIAQINLTFTERTGTLRGMHYQRPPHMEMKLIMCLRGAIWDVAVDLRTGSPTFLQWYAAELTANNQMALLIPEGFAHGYQTLADNCELLYLHSHAYAPDAEAGINPKDPLLSIPWPLEISELSVRDSQHPLLDSNFTGVTP